VNATFPSERSASFAIFALFASKDFASAVLKIIERFLDRSTVVSSPPDALLTGDPLMNQLIRRTITHPALAFGSTILCGLLELIALQRTRFRARSFSAGRAARPATPGLTRPRR
jgi:hypothetical protein